jgi:OOP family OmpA-OmpF porin
MQQPDSDGDGIIDTLDICPDTPPGAAVDAKGCTVTTGTSRKAEAAMRFCDKLTSLAITFDSGRDDVKAAYHEELARVGIFLKEYPNAKGTIAGHTDNSGPLALNMALSQKRAENVRDFIVTTFGIDRSRLTAVGFGPTKPVASNTTSAGKTKNRRIEAVFSCK